MTSLRNRALKTVGNGNGKYAKRSALETISSINNSTRIQPPRAAKTKSCDIAIVCEDDKENVNPREPGKIFIYADDDGDDGYDEKEAMEVSEVVCPAVQSNDDNSIPKPSQGILKVQSSILNIQANLPSQLPCYEDCQSPMLCDSTIEDATKNKSNEQLLEENLRKLFECEEYSDEIYKHLRKLELKHRPKPHYMSKQSDITCDMRRILVDWLVEVAEEYNLQQETIYLTINYVDRFLSQMSVLRGKLQLVGAAAMFVAAKYQEIYPPSADEFVYITDDTYTRRQILLMEQLILKVLSFDVAVPTINFFCEKALVHCDADKKTASHTKFMAELCLLNDTSFLRHKPSLVACSAVCLARQMHFLEPWPNDLQQRMHYCLSDLMPCMKEISLSVSNSVNSTQQCIRQKYHQSKWNNVSELPPPTLHLTEGIIC